MKDVRLSFALHGENLFLKIQEIFGLPEEELKKVRENAYKKVIKDRDFYTNFGELLKSLWG